MTSKNSSSQGFDLSILNIKEEDYVTKKFLMLIEGQFGFGVKKSIEKYGYTEPRFYQLLKAFKSNGIESLFDKKTGPKNNSIRTDITAKQILRIRFLNPNDSAVIIAQKLNQQGIKISVRSVERTITEYGVQKKTALSSTQAKKK